MSSINPPTEAVLVTSCPLCGGNFGAASNVFGATSDTSTTSFCACGFLQGSRGLQHRITDLRTLVGPPTYIPELNETEVDVFVRVDVTSVTPGHAMTMTFLAGAMTLEHNLASEEGRQRFERIIQSDAVSQQLMDNAMVAVESVLSSIPAPTVVAKAYVDSLPAVDQPLQDGVACDCTICHAQTHADWVRLPECAHVFHKACIIEWWHRSPTCPICRVEMPTESES